MLHFHFTEREGVDKIEGISCPSKMSEQKPKKINKTITGILQLGKFYYALYRIWLASLEKIYLKMVTKISGPAPKFKDAQSRKIIVSKLNPLTYKDLLRKYRGQRIQNRVADSLPNEPVQCIQCEKILTRPHFNEHKKICPKRELIVGFLERITAI